MPNNLSALLVASSADGAALTNSTAEVSLLPAALRYVLPARRIIVGKAFRMRASGRISTVVTTPGTLQLRLKFGDTAVFASGAMPLNVVAQTNVPWDLDVLLTCRAAGFVTASNLMGQGVFRSHAVIGSPAPTVGGVGMHILPFNTPPVAGSGFSNVAAQLIGFTGQWSVANAANSITCHQFVLEDLNSTFVAPPIYPT